MVARTGLLFALAGASVLAFHACSSDDPAPKAETQPCLLNSDCTNPLSCTFGRCHKTCTESRDCPTVGQRCVKGPTGPVCQLPDEAHCTYSSECGAPLKCAVDSVCRVPCQGSADCFPKQTCISFVCADSFDVDQTTQELPHTNPVGGWNGSTDDAGIAARDSGSSIDAEPASTSDVSDATVSSMASDVATDSAAPTADVATGTDAPANSSGSSDGGVSYVLESSTCDAQATGLGTFHPSNLPAVLDIPTGLVPLVYKGTTCIFDTDALSWGNTCTLTASDFAARAVQLADGREAAVFFVASLQTNMGSTFTFTGMRPLIIVATTSVQIGGTFATSASTLNGYHGGGAPGPATPGRNGICPLDSKMGYGAAGASMNSRALGGGGGGFCKNGGAGSAPGDGGVPALGGSEYGNAELVPLVGGSSGGSAQYATASAYGGGALQIVAGDTISITASGVINMGGGIGTTNYGSGGGSGGAILLEAPKLDIQGVLAANGAGGGAYQSNSQDGQPSAQQANGATQSSTPGGRAAGKGGAGTTPQGADGQSSAADDYAGGGGGAAGRIRLNAGCGGIGIKPSAVISPTDTACYSQGMLK